MKSTYAIAMLVLLLVGIGGSVWGYKTAVNKIHAHEAHAEESHAEDTHADEAEHADETHEDEEVPADEEHDSETADVKDTEEAKAEPVSEDEAVPADEEAEASAAAGTASASAGDVDNGKSLYTGQCAGCHGANAEGGLGPALNEAAAWTDSEFHSALRTGDSPDGKLKAPMPQFGESQLSDSDITDIHAFLQSL